jgi:hypothetical protein
VLSELAARLWGEPLPAGAPDTGEPIPPPVPRPDPAAFGDWGPQPDRGALTVHCLRCDVKWAWAPRKPCWICGSLAPDY